MKSLLLAALLATGGLVACASDGYPIPVEKSSGVVLDMSPQVVWEEARRTILYIGRQVKVEEATRTARAFIGLGSVTVRVDEKSDGKAILRVVAQSGGADAPETAEKVQMQIQQQLLQRR